MPELSDTHSYLIASFQAYRLNVDKIAIERNEKEIHVIEININLLLKERKLEEDLKRKKAINRLMITYKRTDTRRSIADDLENCIGANNTALIKEYMLKPPPAQVGAAPTPA